MTYDFDKSLTNEQCAEIVIKNAKDGSIVVFHDTQQAKVRLLLVLPKLLDYYTEKGFQFDKIEV
jgi:peptidoglycan/xylan/chitin deacetylase (PgdA/CDA1 family)